MPTIMLVGPVSIAADEVTLKVIEYRPVYVDGDVSKPGAQPYRPGLRVGQVVSLSGGYDIMHFRMNNPFIEQANLKADYEKLWVLFARNEMKIRRLRSELDHSTKFSSDGPELPVSKTVLQQFEELERGQLQAHNAMYQKESSFLQSAVAKTTKRIDLLAEQQNKEKAGADADVEELERLQSLLKSGNTQVTRVIDAKRSILLSSTRLLQTIALASQTERERDEYNTKLTKLDDLKRSTILENLSALQGGQASIRAQLSAVGEKLTYTSLVRSRLVSGKDSDPQFFITRVVGNEQNRIPASSSTELLPGDVVEVALKKGYLPDATGEKEAGLPETPDQGTKHGATDQGSTQSN